ncbi:PAS domain S-box protein [Paenibacillus alkaliterrae]|uniref:GGDEF domain-containing protein n=1 Tax=Paenibacillus alkaliterrae TaxID=320909 RepID=UPI001F3A1BCF|nr:GGDEF domain-containing protein [Paenibacillus alkaliterrae]MCF2938880.1 PAS domain S-box protein [Paenibacillus alkaliterrae]
MTLIPKSNRDADLFRSSFHYAPIGMALVELEGRIMAVNPSALAMLGYEEQELYCKTYAQITHPDDLEKGLLYTKQLLEGEIDTFQLEKRYVHKSGKLVNVLLTVSIVYDEQGVPLHFISQMMDITEKVKAKSEVKQLNRRISNILESISDAFFSLDKQFRFIYANKAASKMFRRSEAQLIDHVMWDVFPSLVGTISENEFRLAMESQQQRMYEQFIPQYNQWFEANVYPSEFGLSVHFREVTERKRTADKLQESEKSFRLLAENSSDMISKHSRDGSYTYVSPACYLLLGYRDDELIGRTPAFICHPDDKQRLYENQELIYDQMDANTISYRLRRKDGTYRWFETTSRVVFHEEDRTHTLVAVSRDITPRKEIELKMLEQYQILHALSHIDELTNIANRRTFEETWNQEWKDALHHDMPITLMLCDIDDFKTFNDTFGHQKGDECLRQIASAMRKALKRPLDIVARYGGEEFAIILPQTSQERAATIAEQLREAVQRLQIPHSESTGRPYVTISLGSATWKPEYAITQDGLFTLADQALYQAKREGKNRYAATIE